MGHRFSENSVCCKSCHRDRTPFPHIPQAHDLPRPLSISFHRLHSLTPRLWLTYMPWRLPFDVPEIAWQFYKFSSCLIIQQLKWNSHNSPRHCVLFGATLQGPLYPYPWPVPPSEPTFPLRNLQMLNVLSSEHGHHSYTISLSLGSHLFPNLITRCKCLVIHH